MYQNDPHGLYYSDFEKFKIGGSEVYWAELPILGRSTLKSACTLTLRFNLIALNYFSETFHPAHLMGTELSTIFPT